MSLITVASKIVAGTYVVALCFWITLQLLHYQESTSVSAATGNEAARERCESAKQYGSDERSSRVDDLAVTWNAAESPNGSHTAMLLEDRSKLYGSIMQEVSVANNDRTHTISIDFKADTTPIAKIVMVYRGGGQQKTYYAFLHLNNPYGPSSTSIGHSSCS